MPIENNWPLLSEAFGRLDGSSAAAAIDIIGGGQVPDTAHRGVAESDEWVNSLSKLPDGIEPLLAKARFSHVQCQLDEIYAFFGDPPKRSIVRFFAVRVCWPMLVDRLQSAGLMTNDSVEPAAGFTAERKHPGRPGPKSGATTIKELACGIARNILEGDQRPRPGYGRLMALARVVNADAKIARLGYQDDSIRKMIADELREWEAKHPHK
jgi:hypothetical protein